MPEIVVQPETLRALKVALTSAEQGIYGSHRELTQVAHQILHQISAALAMRAVEAEQSQRALDACRASERDDCSYEAQRLCEAQRRLHLAREAHLSAVQAFANFQTHSAATLRRIDEISQRGQRFINKKLEKVAQVDLTSGGSRATTPRGRQVPQPHLHTTNGVQTVFIAPGMPPSCAMVPIAMIDQTEDPITGPQDFHKGYTIEDLDYAFELLETIVLPALATGANGDDFAALDLANKQWGTRSLSMTYSQFLDSKSDAIRLELRPDGRYHIDNGRHRVWVASVTGRTHVPAHLLGPQP